MFQNRDEIFRDEAYGRMNQNCLLSPTSTHHGSIWALAFINMSSLSPSNIGAGCERLMAQACKAAAKDVRAFCCDYQSREGQLMSSVYGPPIRDLRRPHDATRFFAPVWRCHHHLGTGDDVPLLTPPRRPPYNSAIPSQPFPSTQSSQPTAPHLYCCHRAMSPSTPRPLLPLRQRTSTSLL
jgi:hypothetical protein